MRDRAILHSDINCCYAQIECQADPACAAGPWSWAATRRRATASSWRRTSWPSAPASRPAMTLWEARKACPGLVVVPPDYRLYARVSRRAREIYYDYTDRVEPFGPDEAWLDVTARAGAWACPPPRSPAR